MRLIEYAQMLWGERTAFKKDFDESIAEAEIIERKAKAFDWCVITGRFPILVGAQFALTGTPYPWPHKIDFFNYSGLGKRRNRDEKAVTPKLKRAVVHFLIVTFGLAFISIPLMSLHIGGFPIAFWLLLELDRKCR